MSAHGSEVTKRHESASADRMRCVGPMLNDARLIAHLQRGVDALRPLTGDHHRNDPARCEQATQTAYDAMMLTIELLRGERP